jgi:Resolvase, N terminal domain
VIYGYARVSTTDQDHASQVEHLTAAGALKVFSEKASGKDADRIQLKKAIAALDAGDVLMVTRIDRLARSTRDLLNIVHDVKQAGATFKSLAEPWPTPAVSWLNSCLRSLRPSPSSTVPLFSSARPAAGLEPSNVAAAWAANRN